MGIFKKKEAQKVTVKESFGNKIDNKIWETRHFVDDNKGKFIAGGLALGGLFLGGLAKSKLGKGSSDDLPEDPGDYCEIEGEE